MPSPSPTPSPTASPLPLDPADASVLSGGDVDDAEDIEGDVSADVSEEVLVVVETVVEVRDAASAGIVVTMRTGAREKTSVALLQSQPPRP